MSRLRPEREAAWFAHLDKTAEREGPVHVSGPLARVMARLEAGRGVDLSPHTTWRLRPELNTEER